MTMDVERNALAEALELEGLSVVNTQCDHESRPGSYCVTARGGRRRIVHVFHDAHAIDPQGFTLWTSNDRDKAPYTASGWTEAAEVAHAIITKAFEPCTYCGRRALLLSEETKDWYCDRCVRPLLRLFGADAPVVVSHVSSWWFALTAGPLRHCRVLIHCGTCGLEGYGLTVAAARRELGLVHAEEQCQIWADRERRWYRHSPPLVDLATGEVSR